MANETHKNDALMQQSLVTVEDVARMLNATPRTVRNLMKLKNGPLPFLKLGGMLRFDPQEVSAWCKMKRGKSGARAKRCSQSPPHDENAQARAPLSARSSKVKKA